MLAGAALLLLSGVAQAAQSAPKLWPPITIFSADAVRFAFPHLIVI